MLATNASINIFIYVAKVISSFGDLLYNYNECWHFFLKKGPKVSRCSCFNISSSLPKNAPISSKVILIIPSSSLLSLPSSLLYRTDLFMYALFKRSFSVEERKCSIKINESTKIRFSSGLRCEQNLPKISQQKKIEESVLMKTSWRPLISVREFCFLENPDFR